ncbi:radiation-inducible immediate-early gene IEX-1-like [Myotis daubentonii]|uniref:radiation-inducible immediate-early gene IEX-1-like n=1 Tax=Myotis daubentonii TaxID=98922 RepID=UPI002872C7F8|nr:radiation-inducible immediate-early gene IEX-1-like [Myotis daubentonii]
MSDPLFEPVVIPTMCLSASQPYDPLPTSGLAPAACRRSESCQKAPLSPAHHRLLPDLTLKKQGALAPEDAPSAVSLMFIPAPAALKPLNLTAEPSNNAMDLGTFLQEHTAAF